MCCKQKGWTEGIKNARIWRYESRINVIVIPTTHPSPTICCPYFYSSSSLSESKCSRNRYKVMTMTWSRKWTRSVFAERPLSKYGKGQRDDNRRQGWGKGKKLCLLVSLKMPQEKKNEQEHAKRNGLVMKGCSIVKVQGSNWMYMCICFSVCVCQWVCGIVHVCLSSRESKWKKREHVNEE